MQFLQPSPVLLLFFKANIGGEGREFTSVPELHQNKLERKGYLERPLSFFISESFLLMADPLDAVEGRP